SGSTGNVTVTNTIGYPFVGNATTTTLTFSNGLLSLASSTIGNGTQAGGLTISGGATTTATSTLNGLIVSSGNVGIGTNAPAYKLDVSGQINSSNKITASESTGTTNGGFTFTQDGAQDTGMFSPSDGELDFYNNGNLKLSINPSGNVAITNTLAVTASTTLASLLNVGGLLNANGGVLSTASSTFTALHLKTATFDTAGNILVPQGTTQALNFATSTTATPILTLSSITNSQSGAVGIGTTTPWGKLSVEIGTLNPAFVVSNFGSSSPAFLITSAGNVGIGTSSPFQALSTVGSGFFTGNVTATNLTATGTLTVGTLNGLVGANNGTLYNIATSSNFVTSLAAGSGISLSGSTGAVTVTNTIGYPFVGNATTTQLAFNGGLTAVGATTTALAVTGSTTISSVFNVGGNAFFNSNVGIGTTSPWGRLSVDTSSLSAGVPEFAIGSSTRTDFTINQNGNVGIGTASPGSTLSVNGNLSLPLGSLIGFVGVTNAVTTSNYAVYGDASNSILNVPTGGTISMRFNNATTCTLTAGATSWGCTSDERLKTSVNTLAATSSLAAIMQLRPVNYHWADAQTDAARGPQAGFLAQEVAQVFPNLVTNTHATTTIVNADGSTTTVPDTLTLNYAGFAPYLAAAIQEQQQEITGLASSSVQMSNGTISLSSTPTTTIVIGTSTWMIATSSATGTQPIFAVTAPASSTPIVSINGEFVLNGQDVSSIASTSATTTPAALVQGPFASATAALQQAITTALNAIQNIFYKDFY
ncbi:MAG TPA: tail fiber domain-containing protein, partial [Candidatus Paceibacterota bacterium]